MHHSAGLSLLLKLGNLLSYHIVNWTFFDLRNDQNHPTFTTSDQTSRRLSTKTRNVDTSAILYKK
jgi:hypothetical protein